ALGERGHDLVEADSSAGFNQHKVSLLYERLQELSGARGVVEVVQAIVGEAGLFRAVEERAAPPADADDDVDRLRHAPPRLGVVLDLALAELQQVADDGDAAAARGGLPEQREPAGGGVGVRVES